MAKLTITVPDQVADAAKRLAGQRGTSVSALAAQGLRNQVTAAAAASYREWLAANPDIAEMVADWRATVDADRPRWQHDATEGAA